MVRQKYGNLVITSDEGILPKNYTYKSFRKILWLFSGDFKFELDHDKEDHVNVKWIFYIGTPIFHLRFRKSGKFYIRIMTMT
ncbi:hypothetical protein DD594_26215, partial [Enterobacter cloacae complex sp. 4DZ1-17B1]